jgi:hypothetical protein
MYVKYTTRHKPAFHLLIDLRAVIGVPTADFAEGVGSEMIACP